MKRILILLLLASMVSAIEDCDKFERVPLDVPCNIIVFSVNTSNTSQFYTDATCTIDITDTAGSLDVDDGAMDSNADGSYNYSYASATSGFGYYQVICTKLGDYGGVSGSINFGLTNTEYIIDINNTVYRIEGNLSNLNLTSVNITINDVNTTVYAIQGSIAELNDTLIDVNLTVTNMNITLTDLNTTLTDVNSTLGTINSTLNTISSQGGTSHNYMAQLTQILEDIYGVLWTGANVSERFNVLVDDSINFTSPEINRRVSDNNLTIDQSRYLTNGTVYYYKVRVVEDGGYGVWSEVNQFTAAFD